MNILKAMVNKPIKVETKDDLSLVSKRYIYSVDTDACVVTRDYISEYIKAADRDSVDKAIKCTDIDDDIDYNDINDIDYNDVYDDIDDYEYPYNHINRSELQV